VKSVKRAIEAPSAVAGVSRGVIREVPRQVTPLTSGTYQIENRVNDFTPVELRRTTRRLLAKQRSDLGPLIIGQVKGISASHVSFVLEEERVD
jgi:hypothetical protein